MTEMKKFYEALEKLSPLKQNIENARSEIKGLVGSFKEDLFKVEATSKQVDEITDRFKTAVQQKVQNWLKTFEADEETKWLDTVLDNSFVLIIYGKVKAGKSTLGNFVAANKLEGQDISFCFFDENNEPKRTNKLMEFETDILECTAHIQLFRLGGMTWVDTPGLSSMTKENGELARKIIDKASFVIFPTSSDSPLQQDEIAQIKELVKELRKKLSIFITKSDNVEEDEVDGKIVATLVNKSEQNRQAQNQDVRTRLEQEVDLNKNLLGEVISFSTKAAKTGLEEGNNELYLNSNMEGFYKLLTHSVIARAEELTKKAPLEGLIGVLDMLRSGLDDVKKSFNELENEFNKLGENAKSSLAGIKVDIGGIIYDEFSNGFNDINAENSKGALKAVINNIDEKTTEVLNKELTKLLDNFDKNVLSALNIPEDELQIKNQYTDIRIKDNYKVSGSLAGMLIGGAIGLIGGPAGAALGATIGAALGRIGGSCIDDEEIYKELIGDNKAKIIQDFKSKCEKHYKEDLVNSVEKEIENKLIKPTNKILKYYSDKIRHLEQDIAKLKKQFQKGE